MSSSQSPEIKPHPLAQWVFGFACLPTCAFMFAGAASYYNNGDYLGCIFTLPMGALLAFLGINIITTKIFLSDDSIEIRSLILPNRKMFKKDIQSKTPYSGGKGAHGFLLNPTDPAIKRARVDLTTFSSANEKLIRDFLRDVPVQHRKKKKFF